MFTIAILIGIYSFTIFFLGLLDQLYKNSIVLLTLTYCFLLLLFYRKLFLIYIKRFFYFINQITRSRLLLILVIVILLQVLVNFIGALGPELAFAVWYLTPKTDSGRFILPFIDSSWVQKGDKFNYIATQNTDLPKRFSYWNYPTTKVKLYSLGGQTWAY